MMGLFRKKTAKQATRPVWPVCGRENAKAYIYDGEPLKRLKTGARFKLAASFKPLKMTSKATGGTWDSSDGSSYALMYEGKPVGFATYGWKFLREADAAGYEVQIEAVCEGEYMPGIPAVKLKVPPYEEGRSAWKNRT